jgi:hypothetical protein
MLRDIEAAGDVPAVPVGRGARVGLGVAAGEYAARAAASATSGGAAPRSMEAARRLERAGMPTGAVGSPAVILQAVPPALCPGIPSHARRRPARQLFGLTPAVCPLRHHDHFVTSGRADRASRQVHSAGVTGAAAVTCWSLASRDTSAWACLTPFR